MSGSLSLGLVMGSVWGQLESSGLKGEELDLLSAGESTCEETEA